MDSVVVSVNGSGIPIINAQSVESFATPLCDSVGYDTLYARNIGSGALSITSAAFAQGNAGYSILSPNNYPLTITPGDSTAFIVRFAPQSQGAFNDTLLLYNNDTIIGHSPWRIALSGKHNAIALSAPALNFGNLPAANFPVTKTLTISNTGSIPITITAGYFNGAAPFVIVSGIPATIPPGSSVPVVIRFDDPGADTLINDTMHFIFSPECTPFAALITGSRGNTPPIIQSTQSFVNGSQCDAFTLDTVFIHNAGGTALRISSANFAIGMQGFSVVTPSAFPITVAPNDSMMIVVEFQPPAPGTYNDTLLIANNDTITSHDPWRIAFAGTKSTPQNIGTLSIPVLQAAPGDTIVVPIILQSQDSAHNIVLTVRVRYDASILLPISATGGRIDSIGTGFAIFTSHGNSTTDTIGKVTFIVALGDSVLSPITLDTVLSGGCPVVFSQAGGEVQLTGLCQQGGTRLFVNNGTLSLAQNSPNPFSSATDIVFSTIENGSTRLIVSNVLGQTAATLVDADISIGIHTVHFDASTLRSGTYYYTLQTPTQSLRRAMIIAH